MGIKKKGRAEALPIRTLTGYGAQVARQRLPYPSNQRYRIYYAIASLETAWRGQLLFEES